MYRKKPRSTRQMKTRPDWHFLLAVAVHLLFVERKLKFWKHEWDLGLNRGEKAITLFGVLAVSFTDVTQTTRLLVMQPKWQWGSKHSWVGGGQKKQWVWGACPPVKKADRTWGESRTEGAAGDLWTSWESCGIEKNSSSCRCCYKKLPRAVLSQWHALLIQPGLQSCRRAREPSFTLK